MAEDPLSVAFDRPPVRLETPAVGRAAVALIVDKADQVFFIRRADNHRDPWSGHVGLPGGHVEEGEDFREAAMRETREEVGLDLGRATLLGTLDDATTPKTLPSKVIRPFVFRLDDLGPLSLEVREVASAHTLPLQHLLDGRGRTTFQLDYRGTTWTMPCVDFDGVRLWGLTLRLVDDLLHRLDGGGYGIERDVVMAT